MSALRPADLAREHGLSTQAVRNYEEWGVLPPSERAPSGHRRYAAAHAAALRAFVRLREAHGHEAAVRIMQALNTGETDVALRVIDEGHRRLARDRSTLEAVTTALGHLATEGGRPARTGGTPRTIGDLAHRLGVTPATVRVWERAGILQPARDPSTGFRTYDEADVRDADLADMLRRAGYRLERIAVVLEEIRTAGGTEAIAAALGDWHERLTARGLAMLTAAARVEEFLVAR